MGRPSTKNLYWDQLLPLYVEEKRSLVEISGQLGPSVQTLSRWLREEGIQLEPRPRNPNEGRSSIDQQQINAVISASRTGKGTGHRVLREERSCKLCDQKFICKPSSQKQFDSSSCARTWDGRIKREKTEAAWYAKPDCRCVCGGQIDYERRHTNQYCSDACSRQYGKKRQRNPENWMTRACRNCNQDFELRKSSHSYGYYCSNKCAQKHTKTKHHVVIKENDMVLDSGWEALFYGLCMYLKIPIDRYGREDAVEWWDDRFYAPDFVVQTPKGMIAIEIKGRADNRDFERWTAFRQRRAPLAVVGQYDMDRLRACATQLELQTLLMEIAKLT